MDEGMFWIPTGSDRLGKERHLRKKKQNEQRHTGCVSGNTSYWGGGGKKKKGRKRKN